MTTPATTGTAPTAAPVTTASAPSKSSTSSTQSVTGNSVSKPVTPLSTADFRSQILGRSSASSFDDSSDSDSDNDVQDSTAESVDFSDGGSSDSEESGDLTEQLEQQLEGELTKDEEDWSWAEGYKEYRDGLHGVATNEVLQALAQGQLPEALMDKLTLTMRDGDEEWTGTVGDLRNSAQMHSNYTRKSQALSQEKQEFAQERGELIDHFRSWRSDPEKGYIGLTKMLGEEAVLNIAKKVAMRLELKEQVEAAEAAGQIPAGTAALVMEREALKREVEETRRYKARDEEKNSTQKMNQQAAETGKRLNNEAIQQFKAAGLSQEDLTPGVWNLFKEELGALWSQAPDKTPGPSEIRTAVMATKQRVERLVAQHQSAQAQKQPAGQSKPAVTGVAPAGAPAPGKAVGTPGGGRSKALSTNDFRKNFMGGRR